MKTSSKKPKKPTVFLSHSAANRRELVALKDLLDQRAAGMMEFFLSSDYDSIRNGTVWPTEVQNALKRMQMMIVFASKDALESAWTYFETGFGMHKLGAVQTYCLPRFQKGELRGPFNILQAHTLHTPRDLSELLKQINLRFDSALSESVSKTDYEQIFRRPRIREARAMPEIRELVAEITVTADGPAESGEIFQRACDQCVHDFTNDSQYDGETWCSMGIRLFVENPIPFNPWRHMEGEEDSVEEKAEQERRKAGPRGCRLTLLPLDFSNSVQLLDEWLNQCGSKPVLSLSIKLTPDAYLDSKRESIGAKIHGTRFRLKANGDLYWNERVTVSWKLDYWNHDRRFRMEDGGSADPLNFSGFQIDEILAELYQVEILTLESAGRKRR